MPVSTLTIMSNIRTLVLHSQIVNLLANRDRDGVFADSGFVTYGIQQNLLTGQNLAIFTKVADCRMTAIPIQSGMPDAPHSLEERIRIGLLDLIPAIQDSLNSQECLFSR